MHGWASIREREGARRVVGGIVWHAECLADLSHRSLVEGKHLTCEAGQEPGGVRHQELGSRYCLAPKLSDGSLLTEGLVHEKLAGMQGWATTRERCGTRSGVRLELQGVIHLACGFDPLE